MKRTIVLWIVFVLLAVPLIAQVSVRFNAGYNIPLAGATIDQYGGYYDNFIFPMYDYRSTFDSMYYKQRYVSLGQGFNFDGAVTMMLSDNIGFDFGFGFINGNTPNIVHDVTTWNYTITYSYSTMMFRFIPTILFTEEVYGMDFYSRMGLVFSMGKIKANYVYTDPDDKVEWETVLKGGLSLGMTGALGAVYNLTNNLGLFMEVNFISLSYAPHKGEIVKYMENGRDRLNDLQTEDRKFVFERAYYIDRTTSHPDYEPTILRKIKFPMSSWGLQLGIKLSL